jgi:hypothetical protein
LSEIRYVMYEYIKKGWTGKTRKILQDYRCMEFEPTAFTCKYREKLCYWNVVSIGIILAV